MFYRVRFDGYLGAIFKLCQFDTASSLDFWPVGATAEWVKRAKSKGWKPAEAAALAVSQVAIERVEAGQISSAEKQFIVGSAIQVAEKNGARKPVLDHLAAVMF